MKKIFSTVLFFLFLTTALFAQGQVFTADEADKNFGTVLESQPVTVSIFKTIVAGKEKFGFTLDGEKIVMADGSRNTLFDTNTYGSKINSNIILYYFGSGPIKELLKNGTGDYVYFEKRSGVRKNYNDLPYMTIRYGAYVLELSNPCPPDC